MYEYRVIKFSDSFETDDAVEVVSASMSAQGTQASNENAHNFALVRREVDAEYECGVELDNGNTCGRTVDSPDANCWQHEDD